MTTYQPIKNGVANLFGSAKCDTSTDELDNLNNDADCVGI